MSLKEMPNQSATLAAFIQKVFVNRELSNSLLQKEQAPKKPTRAGTPNRNKKPDKIQQKIPRRVYLAGWVFRHRDQGGCIFVDLRDAGGFIQLVFDRNDLGELFLEAEQIRSEYVLYVQGQLRMRSSKNVNANLPEDLGTIEVAVEHFVPGAKSPALPISVDEHDQVSEEKRLRYRFLDLRRAEMHSRLWKRSQFNQCLRTYLTDQGFCEIETPILSKPTPEGARDFLVPSRAQQAEGSFYALPQSPQLLKQVLMVSGYERYFQIARCFRDEDLRADRQPEFTQLDLEMSFLNEELMMRHTEEMWTWVLQQFMGIRIATPWPRMTHAQALRQTGSDKPDLRFGMHLTDISDLVRDSEFSVFRKVLAAPTETEKTETEKTESNTGGRVQGICFAASLMSTMSPQSQKLPSELMSRKVIDELTQRLIEQSGIQGLAWFKHEDKGLHSNISKFFTPSTLAEIAKKMKSQKGDVLFFVADEKERVQEALGFLRNYLAKQYALVPTGDGTATQQTADRFKWNFVWVTEFPLFQVNESGQLEGAHHPFAAPSESCAHLFGKDFSAQRIAEILQKEPASLVSRSYDLVLNGVEVGGGSMRNSDAQVQRNILTCLGLDGAAQQEQFGFLLEALEYGCPIHGGIAFGLDRLLMLLLQKKSIREVIAFPKTQKGQCLYTGAPSRVEAEMLSELGLRSAASVARPVRATGTSPSEAQSTSLGGKIGRK